LLGASDDDACLPTKEHIPELAPVFEIFIDQQRRPRIRPHILDAAQLTGIDRLRLTVDGVVERLPEQDEAHRDD